MDGYDLDREGFARLFAQFSRVTSGADKARPGRAVLWRAASRAPGT